MDNVSGFGVNFDDLPPDIKKWVQAEAKKNGMDLHQAMPAFTQPCKHLEATFCSTHSSVWPDIVMPEGSFDGCLFAHVLQASAKFAHEGTMQSGAYLVACVAAWQLMHSNEEK